MSPDPPIGPDLLELTSDLCTREVRPLISEHERHETFPRDLFRTLGAAGLLSLPYPDEYGGGGLDYAKYLSVLEELSRTWLAVGLGVSVHVLSCFPVAEFGTKEQRDELLPQMLSGDLLGAFCLTEPEFGSDAGSLQTTAALDPSGQTYSVVGQKAFITHAGSADFYNLMVRTGGPGPTGISCLLADLDTPGMRFGPPEKKMGMRGSVTAAMYLDHAEVPGDRLIGSAGSGFQIAMAALNSARLGISACAVGLAQAALDESVAAVRDRGGSGGRSERGQGVEFQLADMESRIQSARALYRAAASCRESGDACSGLAASAKLISTDMVMSVTSSAVEILGQAGVHGANPVERYFREAKVLQIVEGTNQIQRLVISRELLA